jgi:ATP-dependent Clp protease ATP-binding subunit ClpC
VQIDETMKRLFNPEFLNRIDDTIVFRQLTKEDIVLIIQIQLKKLLARIEQLGVDVHLSDKALQFLADKGYDKQFGARPLRRAMQKYVEDPIAEEILKGTVKNGTIVNVDVAANGSELIFMVETKGELTVPTPTTSIDDVMKEAGIQPHVEAPHETEVHHEEPSNSGEGGQPEPAAV